MSDDVNNSQQSGSYQDDMVDRAVQNLASLNDSDNESGTLPEANAAAQVGYEEPALAAEGAEAQDTADALTEESDPVSNEECPSEDEAPSQEPVAEGEATDEAGQDEQDRFAGAAEAARSARKTLSEGIAAFKSVREATQRHASARGELQIMREVLDAHTAELRHRIDIEQRYPQIVAEQTAELEQAGADEQACVERAERLDAERADLESQLSIMKNRHEDQLRPYRNVAESTKGRSDDAARALADVRRALKGAEGNLTDTTKRRDQRISSAHRAVDNAQERLRKVQAELDGLHGEEAPDTAALTRLQNELASEQAHLDAAQADVTSVTEETRRAVDAAQARVFEQRQQLKQAEREAEAAKKEATERRNEYDALLKQAQDEERALSDQIRLRVTGIEQAHKDQTEAKARIANAQALLDEAEAIHATPQETIALRDQVAREQTDHDVQQDAVDELAASERSVRRGTLKQRLILIAGGVALLCLIIALIVAIVFARAHQHVAKPETTQPVSTQTSTSKAESTASEKSEKDPASAQDSTSEQKTETSPGARDEQKTSSTTASSSHPTTQDDATAQTKDETSAQKTDAAPTADETLPTTKTESQTTPVSTGRR